MGADTMFVLCLRVRAVGRTQLPGDTTLISLCQYKMRLGYTFNGS
jgi:hypothetical protein